MDVISDRRVLRILSMDRCLEVYSSENTLAVAGEQLPL